MFDVNLVFKEGNRTIKSSKYSTLIDVKWRVDCRSAFALETAYEIDVYHYCTSMTGISPFLSVAVFVITLRIVTLLLLLCICRKCILINASSTIFVPLFISKFEMTSQINSNYVDNTVQPVIMSTIHLGSSLHSTSIGQIATTGGGYRACAIEIRNYHRDLELTKPKHYLASGMCAIPLAPVIKPGHTEACFYHSTPATLAGTYGVLTYDIEYVFVNHQRSEILSRKCEDFKLALMWCVPMGGVTQHAVGVTRGTPASSDLYQIMLEGTEPWFSREEADVCATFHTTAYNMRIKVEASISNVNRAVWIVNVQ